MSVERSTPMTPAELVEHVEADLLAAELAALFHNRSIREIIAIVAAVNSLLASRDEAEVAPTRH